MTGKKSFWSLLVSRMEEIVLFCSSYRGDGNNNKNCVLLSIFCERGVGVREELSPEVGQRSALTIPCLLTSEFNWCWAKQLGYCPRTNTHNKQYYSLVVDTRHSHKRKHAPHKTLTHKQTRKHSLTNMHAHTYTHEHAYTYTNTFYFLLTSFICSFFSLASSEWKL